MGFHDYDRDANGKNSVRFAPKATVEATVSLLFRNYCAGGITRSGCNRPASAQNEKIWPATSTIGENFVRIGVCDQEFAGAADNS